MGACPSLYTRELSRRWPFARTSCGSPTSFLCKPKEFEYSNSGREMTASLAMDLLLLMPFLRSHQCPPFWPWWIRVTISTGSFFAISMTSRCSPCRMEHFWLVFGKLRENELYVKRTGSLLRNGKRASPRRCSYEGFKILLSYFLNWRGKDYLT